MALSECQECRHTISESAGSCPSCGYVTRRYNTASRKVLLIIATVFGAFGAAVGFTVGNPVFGAVGAAATLSVSRNS